MTQSALPDGAYVGLTTATLGLHGPQAFFNGVKTVFKGSTLHYAVQQAMNLLQDTSLATYAVMKVGKLRPVEELPSIGTVEYLHFCHEIVDLLPNSPCSLLRASPGAAFPPNMQCTCIQRRSNRCRDSLHV